VTALAGIRAVAAAHAVQVDYVRGVTLSGHSRAELIEAVKRARAADAIVALLGLSPRLEGEEGERESENPAGDRRELGLPGAQSQLLQALLRTGRPVVVVLTGGGALALPDAERAPGAVLMAWYSGEQGGRAIADVLFGDVSPSGRLPVTFYRSAADLPPFGDYRMTNRTYRYFTGTPAYPFGAGRGYASIAYRDVSASPTPGGGATIHATLENQGPLVPTAQASAADEVVLVFAAPDPRAPGDPVRSLVAFHRITLPPHQPRPLDLTIPPSAFTRVTPTGARTPIPGPWKLSVGPADLTVEVVPAAN
jgi:beta-glucosidase